MDISKMRTRAGRGAVLAQETIWTKWTARPWWLPQNKCLPEGSSMITLGNYYDGPWQAMVYWPFVAELKDEGAGRISEETEAKGRRRPEPQSRKNFRRTLPLLRVRNMCLQNWELFPVTEVVPPSPPLLVLEPKPFDATWGSRSRIPDFEDIYYPVAEIPKEEETRWLNSELLEAVSNPGEYESGKGRLRCDTRLQHQPSHLPITPPHSQTTITAESPEWYPKQCTSINYQMNSCFREIVQPQFETPAQTVRSVMDTLSSWQYP